MLPVHNDQRISHSQHWHQRQSLRLQAYPERTDIPDEYQSADIELHKRSNRNEFRKGFKVGAQLVLEMIKPIKWGGRYEQI